jgi:hypothetical protein
MEFLIPATDSSSFHVNDHLTFPWFRHFCVNDLEVMIWICTNCEVLLEAFWGQTIWTWRAVGRHVMNFVVLGKLEKLGKVYAECEAAD